MKAHHQAACQAPNKQLQRTVIGRRSKRQRATAELRRWTSRLYSGIMLPSRVCAADT